MADGLRVLVVDDELPVVDELAFLLRSDPRIAQVRTASSGAAALDELQRFDVDVVFLDIAMPELSGLSVARVLRQFRDPPRVVFVTAHEDHALEAFDLEAVDYVLKPVRADRLREAIRRAVSAGNDPPPEPEATVPVELGGVTRFVPVSEIRYVEAHGDYARLHTASSNHLIRTPISTLEQEWAGAGFVRIHRSLLVATPHVVELHIDGGRTTVLVDVGADDPVELQVSRRHSRELRDLLVRQARPSGPSS